MAFASFADFLAMGKHAPYVWSAYGVTLAIVLWNVVQPWHQRRRLLREQAAMHRRERAAARRERHTVRDDAPTATRDDS